MDDDGNSDDRDSRAIGFALAGATIVAGMVGAVATGGLQVAAWVIAMACLTANVMTGFFERHEDDFEQSCMERDGHAPGEAETAAASVQPTLQPEKSWAASLEKPRSVGRYR